MAPLSIFQTFWCSMCGHNFGTAMGTVMVDDYYNFSPIENNAMSSFCATCGCRRNFYRREEVGLSCSDDVFEGLLELPSQPPPPLAAEVHIIDGGTYPPDDFFDGAELPPPSQLPPAPSAVDAGGAALKRKKTKFTEEQLRRMDEFAERSGWRRCKRDRAIIGKFCQEIGISPEAYKNWVKNHKPAERKRG